MNYSEGEAQSRHVSTLFWGLVLTVFNLDIMEIPLLPDGAGYLLLAIGCHSLVSASPRFSMARNLAAVLVGLWITIALFRPYLPAIVLTLDTLLQCAMIWFLLGGVRDVAKHSRHADLAAKAQQRRVVYVLATLAAVVLVGIAPVSETAAASLVGLGLVSFALFLMILHVLYRVRSSLGTAERVGLG